MTLEPSPPRQCPACARPLQHAPSLLEGPSFEHPIDNYECGRCLTGWYASHPDDELLPRYFLADSVELLPTVQRAIEVELFGVRNTLYRFTIVSVVPSPRPPKVPARIELTARTVDAKGAVRLVAVGFPPARIDDVQYLTDALLLTLPEVLSGTRHPGDVRQFA